MHLEFTGNGLGSCDRQLHSENHARIVKLDWHLKKMNQQILARRTCYRGPHQKESLMVGEVSDLSRSRNPGSTRANRLRTTKHEVDLPIWLESSLYSANPRLPVILGKDELLMHVFKRNSILYASHTLVGAVIMSTDDRFFQKDLD